MKKLILLTACAVLFSVNVFAHQAFTLVSSQKKIVTEAELAKLEKDATVGKKSGASLTFTENEIRLVVVTGPEDDKLSYRIQGMRNPNLIVPSGATLKILFVNLDGDMKHDMRFGHVMGEFDIAPDVTETAGTEKLASHKEKDPMQSEEFVLKANEDGAYKFFCSVRGHAKGGMWGNILVGVKPGKDMKMSVKPVGDAKMDNMPGMKSGEKMSEKNADDMSNMPGMKPGEKMPEKKPDDISQMPGMKPADNEQDEMSTMGMNPYFSAISYPVRRDTMMVMALTDFQSARTGPNFFTGMNMMQYGITSRWTVGAMFEGQKIPGLPTTYGGFRVNSYFKVFPHDHLLNFTVYGEYEGLNGAALYKMEVAGFGGEDLEGPLAIARRTPVRTLELRAIVYHDWGRTNFTFNFVSETPLPRDGNDFGYSWGVFRKPAYMAMNTDKAMTGMTMPKEKAPPAFSFQRLGYGVEMIGALGDAHNFGFDWQRQQHYLGPVFSYAVSKKWTIHLEPAFGLSAVSDPFMLRMGIGYSIDHLLHRR